MARTHSELPVLIVGAGMGGLAASIDLARRGVKTIVIERNHHVGGKMAQALIGPAAVDCGPSVLTMRFVFEQLFADAGADLAQAVPMQLASTIAQHTWPDGSILHLHTNQADNADAIGTLAGSRAAKQYQQFAAYAQQLYNIVYQPFIIGPKPTAVSILQHYKWRALRDLWRIDGLRSMHARLCTFFDDPRLIQLFGRYATYCGGSPHATPATLNLITHVEQQGVWLPTGGMHSMAHGMAQLAQKLGVAIYNNWQIKHIHTQHQRVASVSICDKDNHNEKRLEVAAVIFNGDPYTLPMYLDIPWYTPTKAHIALSAMTLSMVGRAEGMPLCRHNLFFSNNSQYEFEHIFKHQTLSPTPVIYLCAQDRYHVSDITPQEERFFCLVNAPACDDVLTGDATPWENQQNNILQILQQRGLKISPHYPIIRHTPHDFAKRFACRGGAIYGAPPHSVSSFFTRLGSRSPIPGLYLAGGNVHPGPGIPMSTLSGRQAAQAVWQDLDTKALRSVSRPLAMPGGISTQKATITNTP